MSWLIYDVSNGQVVEIKDTEPIGLPMELKTIESGSFKPGDEFDFFITVNLDNMAITAVRQSKPAKNILLQLARLEKATGIGVPGQQGIAKRLDNLELRITALESKIGG